MLTLNHIKKESDDLFFVDQQPLPVMPGNFINHFATPMSEVNLRAWLSCRGVEAFAIEDKIRNLVPGEACYIVFER